MKAETSEVKEDFDYINKDSNENHRSRIDLNDLLKRAKEEEKSRKRTNLLIIASVGIFAFAFVLIINI
tara:strand:- start:101 stop:304 length:204 start_codon:yes stop_codon:yes gene_type:complete